MFAFYVMVAIGTFIDLMEGDDDENFKPTASDKVLMVIMGALWPVLLAAAITHKLKR